MVTWRITKEADVLKSVSNSRCLQNQVKLAPSQTDHDELIQGESGRHWYRRSLRQGREVGLLMGEGRPAGRSHKCAWSSLEACRSSDQLDGVDVLETAPIDLQQATPRHDVV